MANSSSICSRCFKPITEPFATDLCDTCSRSQGTSNSDIHHPAVVLQQTTLLHSLSGEAKNTGTFNETLPSHPLHPSAPGYKIQKLLGSGGMGLVYQACELASERNVAIKFIRCVSEKAARDRFQVEVRALARLRHPHVVQILSVQLEGREPYFTMEYVDGLSLDKLIHKQGTIPFPQTARIIETAARGVQAAHDAGVIHRDLKPSNILVDSEGNSKVTDFGLAKRLDSDDELTVSTMILGTPGYMSPEQANRKHSELTPISDVYCLGATLYALLTNQPPFRGRDNEETVRKVLNDTLVPPSKIRPDVPADLEAICLKCLEKDPQKRYATAQALADDLARWQRGEPTVAQPPTLAQQVWRVTKRKSRWLVGTAAMIAFVLTAAAVPLRGKPKAEEPKAQPDPLEAIYAELDAGKPVTLVGETGKPRWHRWALGEAPLTESPAMDGTAAIQSNNMSFLELLPDPRHNHYRFSAEVRNLHRVRNLWSVGLYVSFEALQGNAGISLYPMIFSEFSDFYDAAELQWPELQKSHGVDAFSALGRHVQGQVPNFSHTGPAGKLQKKFKFEPQAVNPPWRQMIFEVSPAGVELYWRTDENNIGFVSFVDLSSFAHQRRWIRRDLNLTCNDPSVIVPEWKPRLALGIWSWGGTIAFRNVVVTPNPPPLKDVEFRIPYPE